MILLGLSRCGKSCRLRWTNYLRPDIKRGQFSFEEEQVIIHLHGLLGNRCSPIFAYFIFISLNTHMYILKKYMILYFLFVETLAPVRVPG